MVHTLYTLIVLPLASVSKEPGCPPKSVDSSGWDKTDLSPGSTKNRSPEFYSQTKMRLRPVVVATTDDHPAHFPTMYKDLALPS